jgi:mannose-6-phosphate isomerase-like protein (cupin superfamily)
MTGYFGPIEKLTEKNNYFRKVLFTGKHSQLVLMCLKPGEEIGNEVHHKVDQFFRVEKGRARVILGGTEKHLVNPGGAFVVPAGTWHNVINFSNTEALHLYTIYSPANHPPATVHRTKAAAEAAEHHHH